MVDAIGWKAAGVVAKAAPAVTSTAAAAVSTPVKAAAAVTAVADSTTLAQSMAAEPPVDADRVSRIKAAIAAGKFPILPSTIADRLMALKLNWDPNAKA